MTLYILVKAVPDGKERITALTAAGYQPFEGDPESKHYYMKRIPNHEA